MNFIKKSGILIILALLSIIFVSGCTSEILAAFSGAEREDMGFATEIPCAANSVDAFYAYGQSHGGASPPADFMTGREYSDVWLGNYSDDYIWFRDYWQNIQAGGIFCKTTPDSCAKGSSCDEETCLCVPDRFNNAITCGSNTKRVDGERASRGEGSLSSQSRSEWRSTIEFEADKESNFVDLACVNENCPVDTRCHIASCLCVPSDLNLNNPPAPPVVSTGCSPCASAEQCEIGEVCLFGCCTPENTQTESRQGGGRTGNTTTCSGK